MIMAAASLLANLATFDADELSRPATIQQAMHASTVATIVFALVAGLVSATSDYRFGRIDQLLLTTPNPRSIVATKAAVGSIVGVIYGVAGSAVALAVMTTYYRLNDVTLDVTSAAIMRPLVGVIAASAFFAVMGIGAGHAIRNQPAALVGGLVVMLVVQPPLLLGLPDLGRWLPGAAGLAMTLAPDPAMLQQGLGGLVLLGWTALAVAAGTHRLTVTGS